MDRKVDEELVRRKLQELGRQIKAELPDGFEFVLLVGASDEGEGGAAMMYLSTVSRPDAIQLMREFIAVQMEERNWTREMPELELEEELRAWWQGQSERWGNRLPLKWDTKLVKEWCNDAYRAGRSSA